MTEQSSKDLLDEMRWQLEKIRNKQAENRELLGKLDEAQHELSALEATVRSADGHVTVTAGAGGIVRSIEIADSALGTNAATLTATLNDTVRAAIAKATSKQLDIVRTRVGEDVEPVAVLGPQARFADYGRPTRPEPADDHDAYDDPLATTKTRQAPDEPEPVSEGADFLRRLGIDDH